MDAQRIVAQAKNKIDLETFSLPTLGPDEVLLESLYTCISPGTELAWLQHQASTPGTYPWYPGYSGTALVIDKGNGVKSLALGQRVACNLPHSSHHVVNASKCHALAASLDPLEASAFRLASIALQGVRKAQVQLGDSLAVLGLGAIGNLAGQIARAAGATKMVGVDLLKTRRQLALDCEFDIATETTTDTFDVVIEATGVPAAISTAFKLAGQRGRVILLGSPRGITDGIDFYTDVHKKGITIIGAHEKNRSDTGDVTQADYQDERTCLQLLASKRLSLRPLISDIITPPEASSAYQRLATREEGLVLVAFDWQTH